ncbi:hypothetical protein B296_00049452 [Ensete ventricosum]|uniref:Uncharacterized protein n=1 Tax=Ensete ventricosum TaxID=4639 RepID=A0A426XBK5_ENSVE|nr:hypothetical protein B296_00049452 [Ensete ventricosum]
MGGKGFSGGKPKSSYGYPLRPLGGLRRSPLAVRRRFSVRCHGCRDKEIHNLSTYCGLRLSRSPQQIYFVRTIWRQ